MFNSLIDERNNTGIIKHTAIYLSCEFGAIVCVIQRVRVFGGEWKTIRGVYGGEKRGVGGIGGYLFGFFWKSVP